MLLLQRLIVCDKMRILALHLRTFITYARLRGIAIKEPQPLLSNSPTDVGGQTGTFSPEEVYTVLSYIHQELGEDQLGLRVGEYLNLNALGLIYQISLQASTLEEGLLYLKSYLHSTLPLIKVDTLLAKERMEICLSIDQGQQTLNRIMLESTLKVIHRELSMMASEPLDAHLFSPYYHKGYPSPWQKADHYKLTCKPLLLQSAMKDKSRLHLDVLVPAYLELIESMQATHSFTSRVKIALLHMAKPELPSLETVADLFHLTPRTLQRYLKGENQTFRQITDELKKRIAYLLIHHRRFTVTDLSYVLGYGEPAAFIHSFKKWYGQTPNRFRQEGEFYR